MKAAQRLKAADYLDLSIIGSTHGMSDGFSSLLVPVLALIVAELDLSPFRAGLLLSISNVSTFLLLYPLSLLADYGGRKKLILVTGMALASLAFFSIRWAGTFGVLAALAFVAGGGNAVYHPCGTALTAERFPQNRALAISFHSLMGNIGASLMPGLQAAVATAVGWRTAIAACSVPALVLLPLVAARFPRGSRSAGNLTPQRNSTGCAAPEEDIYAPKVPTAISEIASGFRVLTSSVVRNRRIVLLAVIYALKGMGARTALSVPLTISGALALCLGAAPFPILLIVVLTLLGTTGPISPIILTAASDFAEESSLAWSVGFIYPCYGLGFVSPSIAGWLAERFGYFMPFALAALFIWAASATSMALPKVRRKNEQSSEL